MQPPRHHTKTVHLRCTAAATSQDTSAQGAPAVSWLAIPHLNGCRNQHAAANKVRLLLLLHTQPFSTNAACAPAVSWLLMLPSTPIPDSPSLLQMVQLLLHTQLLSTKAASTCCELAADAAFHTDS
jgi:hypothetical protein